MDFRQARFTFDQHAKPPFCLSGIDMASFYDSMCHTTCAAGSRLPAGVSAGPWCEGQVVACICQ